MDEHSMYVLPVLDLERADTYWMGRGFQMTTLFLIPRQIGRHGEGVHPPEQYDALSNLDRIVIEVHIESADRVAEDIPDLLV